jgi:hypothetical protein
MTPSVDHIRDGFSVDIIVGDIQGISQDFMTLTFELSLCLGERLRIDLHQRHCSTFFGIFARHRQAQALTSSGDQRCPTFQEFVWHNFSFP